MSGGFLNEKWAIDPINERVCDFSRCYDPETGETDYYPDCCYGHFADDRMMDISGRWKPFSIRCFVAVLIASNLVAITVQRTRRCCYGQIPAQRSMPCPISTTLSNGLTARRTSSLCWRSCLQPTPLSLSKLSAFNTDFFAIFTLSSIMCDSFILFNVSHSPCVQFFSKHFKIIKQFFLHYWIRDISSETTKAVELTCYLEMGLQEPPSMAYTMSAICIIAGLCVKITIVFCPRRLFCDNYRTFWILLRTNLSSTLRTSLSLLASKAAVTSSNSRQGGSFTSALAIATRALCPPDK